jgi:E3 SUMO-protein ligase PIAS1
MDLQSPPEAEIQTLSNLIHKPSKPQLQTICLLNGLPKTGNKADLQSRITQRRSSLPYPHLPFTPSSLSFLSPITLYNSPHHSPGHHQLLFLTLETVINDSVRKQDFRRYQEVRQSIFAQTGQAGSYASNMAPPYFGAPPQQSPALTPTQRYGASFGSPAFSLTNGQRPPGAAPPMSQATPTRPVAQPRPAAVMTPGFEYKPSPFYEMKRRLGEVRTCESEIPGSHLSICANSY